MLIRSDVLGAGDGEGAGVRDSRKRKGAELFLSLLSMAKVLSIGISFLPDTMRFPLKISKFPGILQCHTTKKIPAAFAAGISSLKNQFSACSILPSIAWTLAISDFE